MRNIGLPSDAFLGVVPTRRDERQRLGDIVFRRRKAGASSSCVAKLCRNVCGVTRRQLHRWTTAVNVKLLLPPRQSRGTSPGRLGTWRSGRSGGASGSRLCENASPEVILAL